MAIQNARIMTDDPSWVHVYGEPRDVEHVMGRTGAESVMVAGYDVKNMGDAQHDGHEAIRFTLTADNREVGRLVLMTTATEYTFEFDVEFESESAAAAFVHDVKNPKPKPSVVRSTQDLAYEDQTLEEAMADLSAAHGVSVRVIKLEGPGGGWPIVSVQGREANVRAALMSTECGWGFTQEEMDSIPDMLEAVTD